MTPEQDESASGGWLLIRVSRTGRETPLPRAYPDESQARSALADLLDTEAAARDWPPTRSVYEKAAAAARAGEPFTLPGGVTYAIRREGS